MNQESKVVGQKTKTDQAERLYDTLGTESWVIIICHLTVIINQLIHILRKSLDQHLRKQIFIVKHKKQWDNNVTLWF